MLATTRLSGNETTEGTSGSALGPLVILVKSAVRMKVVDSICLTIHGDNKTKVNRNELNITGDNSIVNGGAAGINHLDGVNHDKTCMIYFLRVTHGLEMVLVTNS